MNSGTKSNQRLAGRLAFAMIVASCGYSAFADTVCLVNLSNTMFRINSDGNGGVEIYSGLPTTLVAMTIVPPNVTVHGCEPGDVIGMDSASPNALFKVVNARGGTPSLIHIGNCNSQGSSLGFANGQLYTIDNGGMFKRFDLETFAQIGPSIDTTASVNSIGGMAFDGVQTWYAIASANNALYRFPHPPTANSMTLIGTNTLDIGSCGMEISGTSVWVGAKVGSNLAAGTCNIQTGEFTPRWLIPTAINGNMGFVAFEGSNTACDSIDFNNDTSLFDPQDIEAFLSVYSEGLCVPTTATCNDIDFNNDTSLFDPCDINAFLVMYSEGPCTSCGS